MNAPGSHLIVDGITSVLVDEEYLYQFLTDLVSVVHMTPIGEPKVVPVGSGWVGFILLAESHCAVHIHRDLETHVDCFSCKPYSTEEALAFIMDRLKLHNVMHQTIERPMPAVIGGES